MWNSTSPPTFPLDGGIESVNSSLLQGSASGGCFGPLVFFLPLARYRHCPLLWQKNMLCSRVLQGPWRCLKSNGERVGDYPKLSFPRLSSGSHDS